MILMQVFCNTCSNFHVEKASVFKPSWNFYLLPTIFAKKLCHRCLTGFSTPTPLTLTIKTMSLRRFCWLWKYLAHWVSNIFHIFYTNFTNSGFHCFEQLNIVWDVFQKFIDFTFSILKIWQNFIVEVCLLTVDGEGEILAAKFC